MVIFVTFLTQHTVGGRVLRLTAYHDMLAIKEVHPAARLYVR